MEWAEVEYQKWMSSPDYAKVTERAKNAIPPERNLAAVELYRLTKDKKWHDVYLSTRNTTRSDASFIYARLDKTLVNRKAFQAALDELIAEADGLVALSENNAFGITNGSPGRALRSSSYTIPAPATLVRAHFLTGDQKYLKTILRSALYSAGANPLNMCMTTGLGENPVKNALHEDSKHTGQPCPIGITVFGPSETTSSVPSVAGLEERLNTTCFPKVLTWPASESYFDVFWFVTQNEYVVGSPMGPTEYVWGYLAARK